MRQEVSRRKDGKKEWTKASSKKRMMPASRRKKKKGMEENEKDSGREGGRERGGELSRHRWPALPPPPRPFRLLTNIDFLFQALTATACPRERERERESSPSLPRSLPALAPAHALLAPPAPAPLSRCRPVAFASLLCVCLLLDALSYHSYRTAFGIILEQTHLLHAISRAEVWSVFSFSWSFRCGCGLELRVEAARVVGG